MFHHAEWRGELAKNNSSFSSEILRFLPRAYFFLALTYCKIYNMSKMRLFYPGIREAVRGSRVALTGSEHQHLRANRLRPGDRVDLFDANGTSLSSLNFSLCIMKLISCIYV